MTQLPRCFGHHPGQIEYAAYHDHEWGIPEHNDQRLFEMLSLEGAQAGLSWETVLKKRPGYREAFQHFDVKQVSSMTDQDLEALLNNPRIIRNRLKIFSVRQNARVFQEIQKEYGSFDTYLWAFVGHQPHQNHFQNNEDLPQHTKTSQALSKDLKKRGMSFVGPTIMYAYMQAIGMVNDHLTWCWKYQK